jgi:hypothetical protein
MDHLQIVQWRQVPHGDVRDATMKLIVGQITVINVIGLLSISWAQHTDSNDYHHMSNDTHISSR